MDIDKRSTRSFKMLQMLKDKSTLSILNLPSHEKTTGTDKCEQQQAITNWKNSEYNIQNCDSEPEIYQDNGSDDEFVPSNASSWSTSDSDNCELNTKGIKSAPVNVEITPKIKSKRETKCATATVGITASSIKKSVKETKCAIDNVGVTIPKLKSKEVKKCATVNNIKKTSPLVDECTQIPASDITSSSEMCECGKTKKVTNEKIVPISTAPNPQTKSYFCIFCKKLVKRFGRHVLNVHKKEPKVADILRYPSKHSERDILLTQLRNEGTFLYNNDKELNSGELIVSRRPNITKKRCAKDYIPCPKCHAYFVAKNFYRHYRQCMNIKKIKKVTAKKESLQLQVQLHCKNFGINYSVALLLSRMKDDDISDIIKKDQLLVHVASYLCSKYRTEKHLNNHVRQKLRYLARLLMEIKKDHPEIIDFKDCLQPDHFGIVIEGVQKVCELNHETGKFGKPAMANHLGIYLKECVNVLISLCIIEQNAPRKLLVEDFKNLLNFQYRAYISRSALKTAEELKWNKEKLLPATSDITIFRDHLVERAENCCTSLNNEDFSYISWKLLADTTAALVLTFNRKRPGELQRIYLKNYLEKHSIQKESDEYKNLSTLEQILCDSFKRVEFRGKRGRRVPILLRKNHIRYIDTFLKFRTQAGVSENNPYLFGIDDDKYIRLTDIIRRESLLCGASKPELLRATMLRKQVATTSQLLDLNENEMQMLADFMGHDIEIHKTHYRTPELTLQLAKLSKLLIAVDSGEMKNYKNKNFENIDITKFLNTEPNDIETESSDTDEEESNALLNTENINCRENVTHDSMNSEIENLCNTNSNLYQECTPTKSNYDNTGHVEVPRNQSPTVEILNVIENTPTKSKQRIRRKLPFFNSPNKIMLSNTSVTVETTGTGEHKITSKKNIRRFAWITPEKRKVQTLFKRHLENKTLPSEKVIASITRDENYLRRRTPAQIKSWICNEIKRNSRSADPKNI